jgi:hypothetical protein
MQPLVIQIERTDERVADTCAFAKSPVRIGRNPLSDLQLDESFVSQWQGVIRFDDERTTYLDLGSTNPTLIDGQAIPRNVEIEVSEETDIRIGSLRLHVLRVAAPAELFGARRKTSFTRANPHTHGGNVAATMFLGRDPKPALSATGPRVRDADVAGINTGTRAIAESGARARTASARATLQPERRQARHSEPDALAPTLETVLPQHSAADGGDLASSHRDYCLARQRFLAHVQARVAGDPAHARAHRFELLVAEYPELAHEPEVRTLLAQLGIETWRTGVPDMADWLSRLTGGLVPTPGVAVNGALALERIGEVLEVWSSAFIELRDAQEKFCEEIALEKPDQESLLHSTRNPRTLLACLLNPDVGQTSKVTELARAMAEFAVHPVALVGAIVEGAREVLQGLSPSMLTGQGERPTASFFGKLMGVDQKTLWTRYVSAFDETLDEDHFTRKLFGRAFARKYYAITGGRSSVAAPPRTGTKSP